MFEDTDIILASASPRRKELMGLTGLCFRVEPANVPEVVPPTIAVGKQSEFLAVLKAGFLAEQYPRSLIIGADTTVVYEGQVLGKPKDEADAVRMLELLSGRTHTVYTGVALVRGKKIRAFTVATEVTFYELTQQEIRDYVATGEPMDKAGAYGIQGKGCRLVKSIQGDYFSVVGLPVAELIRHLEAF